MLQRFLLSGWLSAAAVVATTGAASAHHVMGGKLPTTFGTGLLSGLGHPIIGLDHLAAIVAVGCIAALHRAGPALALGYVVAMMAGVAVHLQAVTVPGSEVLVALSVIALGAALVARIGMATPLALSLFVAAGMLHGYALGESIVGAERAPLFAYLAGLAAVQAVIALAVVTVARRVLDPVSGELAPVRLLGAGIVGVGLALFVAQIVPAP